MRAFLPEGRAAARDDGFRQSLAARVAMGMLILDRLMAILDL
jgi:hypothetical protein